MPKNAPLPLSILLMLLMFLLAACAAPAVNRSLSGEMAAEAPAIGGRAQDMAAPQVEEARPEEEMAFSSEEAPTQRLVIRNADLTIVVHDPVQSLEELSRMAEEMGGFVVSSNLYQTTYQGVAKVDRASVTLRVPAERLDEALSQIKEGAIEVRSQTVSGEDVTQEYTDLKSRLRNLEAAEEELLEIMETAADADDVLNIFERLRQVRQEIEVTKGRIQYFEQSARLSSISVDLLPDVAAQPLQIGRWQPKGTAKEALEALIKALEFIGDTAIWALICVLPIGLLLGVPAYFVVRAILRRRRAKESESESNPET